MKSNWKIESPDAQVIERLQEELQIPRLLALSLAARGITDVEDAKIFLNPSLDRDWADPGEIPGLEEAACAIAQAIEEQKKTVVFGDFDVDGITATSVMLLGLRQLGLEAAPFIPRRQDEGYGLSVEAVDRIMGLSKEDGEQAEPFFGFIPEFMITVDCGITSRPEVDYLKSLGVDVVVTDHHNPMDSVPEGIPVCNPKLDPNCPSVGLAGVGVALKVVQRTGEKMGKPDVWKGLIDLAALGTIADRMPLRGENRALVAAGIDMIKNSPRPGVMASLALAGDEPKDVTSIKLSFSLIPRLNAAGRMADSTLALRLLLCEDPVEATGLARELEDVNSERRETELELTDNAEEAAALQYDGERVLVLVGEGWHEGVKGIVASRMANKYGVPTILFTVDGDEAHGSGRSVGKINLFEAIESVKDLTVKFGGHKYAAGVTVKTKDLPEFKKRLENYFRDFPEDAFVSSIPIDGIIGFEDLTMDQVESLQRMEPYGQDNMEPMFAMTKAFITRARAVGTNKNHLSFSITNGVADATAIYFHCNDTEEYETCSSSVDLVFSPEIEEWRGRRQLKLKVKDMVPATSYDNAMNDDKVLCEFINNLYDQDEKKICTPDLHVPNITEKVSAQKAVWILPSQEEEDFGSYNLTSELAVALAGHNIKLHQSQRQALELLEEGKSTLVVMATGRGKSMIFYVHAAKIALSKGQQSIFIYPLRALINDQSFHIGHDFARLGVKVQVLTGETPKERRDETYDLWEKGDIDVLLTTPEFLYAHKETLSNSGNVGFIAVDEAHHIATSSDANRPIYTRLDFVREYFPDAVRLAVTATAPAPYADKIRSSLGITETVLDDTVRQNLRIDDKRGVVDRETYLASIVSSGEKSVVYVNSRQATIDLARMLRKRLPDQAMKIAFYNAGLSRDVRLEIESMFRDGRITTVIATSAFGEGVNVPDIRHIVIYHMPFSPLAYNQMAGRGGRDGKPSTIHIVCNSHDSDININVLHQYCPTRDQLVLLYKSIRALGIQKQGPVSSEELLEACHAHEEGAKMSIISVKTGLEVFAELGIIELEGEGPERRASIIHGVHKVDLSSSVRYQEACEEFDSFIGFSDWMMSESAGGLLAGINRPLIPRQNN